jgi:hypothetical protein
MVALALFLFPEWVADHPSEDWIVTFGHGWIFSPPAPPEIFPGMHIERSWAESLPFASIALLAGAALIAIGRRNVKPE